MLSFRHKKQTSKNVADTSFKKASYKYTKAGPLLNDLYDTIDSQWVSDFQCVYTFIQVSYTFILKLLHRVSSFQEFKQSESRTICSSRNYCTNFREKQVKGKETKRTQKVYMKPWFKRRKNLGFYEILLPELR